MATYCEFTMAITVLTHLLASKMTDDVLVIIAAVFTQFGDTLAAITVFKEKCSAETQDNKI